MHYPTILAWALACSLVIHGRSISPRQVAQYSQESVATSFTQVTETYSQISTSFVETRQSIESATTIEQCSSILTQLQTQIGQAVQSISGGCNCAVDGVDTNSLETMISTWFTEFQSIAQVVQTRFPTSYQSYFSSTFTQISTHIEMALGVSYSSGVNMDSVVQRAYQHSNINTNTFSNLHIDTSRFTHISESVEKRRGVFSTYLPGGARFPNRLPGGYHPGSGSTSGYTTNPAHSYPSPPDSREGHHHHHHSPTTPPYDGGVGSTLPGGTREPVSPYNPDVGSSYHNPTHGRPYGGTPSPYQHNPSHGLPDGGSIQPYQSNPAHSLPYEGAAPPYQGNQHHNSGYVHDPSSSPYGHSTNPYGSSPHHGNELPN